MTDHVVVEHPAGGWNVRSATEDRKIEHHYSQDAAISAACTKIRDTGGGELSVHDKHGRIWHHHTITRGR